MSVLSHFLHLERKRRIAPILQVRNSTSHILLNMMSRIVSHFRHIPSAHHLVSRTTMWLPTCERTQEP